MRDFTPRAGAVVDPLLRREELTEKEQRFADWAAERGLFVVFGKVFPEDDDDFEPEFTCELGIEEMVDGQIVTQFRSLLNGYLPDAWPEVWALCEEDLRHDFEETKAKEASP